MNTEVRRLHTKTKHNGKKTILFQRTQRQLFVAGIASYLCKTERHTVDLPAADTSVLKLKIASSLRAQTPVCVGMSPWVSLQC